MNILHMELSASILILMIILIRSIGVYKLPAKAFIAMWEVAYIRLLIPIAFSIPIPVKPAYTINGVTDTVISGRNIQEYSSIIDMKTILCIIWIIGIMIVSFIILKSYLSCKKIINQALPIDDPSLKSWLIKNGFSSNIKLMVSDRIVSPLTYGVFRTKILLPKTMNSDNETQLRYVLLHEKVHIDRKDNVRKILSLVVCCIHWFNPLVWITYVLFNRDVEILCDDRVIKIIGIKKKKEYALTLVDLAEMKNSFFQISNAFGKNAIKERVTLIMKKRKTTLMGIAVASLLVVGSLSVFAKAYQVPNVDTDKKMDSNAQDINEVDPNQEVYTVAEYEKEIADFEKNMNVAVNNGDFTKAEADETLRTMKDDLQKMKDSNGKYVLYKSDTKDLGTDSDGKSWSAMSGGNIDLSDEGTSFKGTVNGTVYNNKQEYLNAKAAESKQPETK